MAAGVAAIVGAGPGVGLAVAKRFAADGFTVAMLARNEEKLKLLAEEVAQTPHAGGATAISCDVTDAASVKAAFAKIKTLGPLQVLVYNANSPFPWPPPKFTDISAEAFEVGLSAACTGAFHCAQQAIPSMLEGGKGTILMTGATASLRGSAGFSTLACGKFALRGLAQCLAREYHPQNIHVAHVIIDGIIQTPRTQGFPGGTKLNPEAIAEAYWQLHAQDASAWTHEIDLRPFDEKF